MREFPETYDHRTAEAAWQPIWAAGTDFQWKSDLPAALDYVIDTPPPTVSGTLHIGHVYSYTQADIIARYFRMSGRNVLYPIGWDDNGLPTERLVEQVKKVRGGAMDREAFVALCRDVITTYEDDFRKLFSRLALSVDWSREYQTISDQCRAISQLSFIDLFNKGLLERRLEPTLWDPADRTAIAQAEVDEREQIGLINRVAFGLEDGGELIIATTRPELLAGCGAIMINPSHPRAAELVGRRAISPLYNVLVPIIADEAVDPEKGTGIVMCCTFGDITDINWWRTHKLPLRIVIDAAGRMIPDLPIGSQEWPSVDAEAARRTMANLAQQKIKQARQTIVELLKEAGALRGQDEVNQVVPVAERSGTPLEILVTPQWFIRTLEFKDALLAKGREINWHPDFMRQRFESWVEGLKWDWSISRQRHFGVAIPVWYSKRPNERGKILLPEMSQLPVDPLHDLPKGYTADDVEPEIDVMDTWATSSVSPQLITRSISPELGYDLDAHRRLFPMSMRPQAHEIIRTWAFYTIVKALLHQGTIPWRDICISGWCVAEDGSKMSKSKGNVIDPIKLLNEYGTDVVRYWTGTSQLGHDTVLSPNTLRQGRRLVTKLWNAARLAHLLLDKAAIKPATPKQDYDAGLIVNPIDKWLLGRLSETVRDATRAFEKYEYAQALRLIEDFFWRHYCDNYLEFAKARVKSDRELTAEQRSALHTVHHATLVLIRLFAPFLPFVCETLNDVFAGESGRETTSVHARGSWPNPEDQVEPGLFSEAGMLAIDVIGGVRKLKSELGVSVYAPVTELIISPAGTHDRVDAVHAALDQVRDDLRETAKAIELRVGDAPADWPSSLTASEILRVSLRLEPQIQA